MSALRWLAGSVAELPSDDDWLGPGERARLAELTRAKRRQDFRLARWVAKQAVCRQAGVAPERASRVEVRPAPGGAPELYIDGAPSAYQISLTDRAGWAVCLLGPAGLDAGCDLEVVEPRSAAFVRDYFTEPEQAVVVALDAEARDRVANALWSAKESALKALRTGLRRDTRSVEVRLAEPTPAPGVWSPLEVRDGEARDGEARMPGWWRSAGSWVLTVVAVRDVEPPVALAGADDALDAGRPVEPTWR